MRENRMREWLREARPWLILASVAGLACWHVLDFSEARETDFPRIVRPFFNPWPPAAYRLAEPGDTLDRLGLYFASIASALSIVAIGQRLRSRSSGEAVTLALWPTALALSLAATWHASTPGPTFDGWHGLGWRVLFDPASPIGLRVVLGLVAIGLSGLIVVNLARHGWSAIADPTQSTGLRALLVFALVFVLLRQVEIPDVGPPGYWPRCAFDLGVLAFSLALVRARPLGGSTQEEARDDFPTQGADVGCHAVRYSEPVRGNVRLGARVRSTEPRGTPNLWVKTGSDSRPLGKLGGPHLAFVASCGILVVGGILVSAYHRPLARLHAVVPGKIYISAMPSYRALSIEQGRLHFRTIINLFDEASTQGSPYHDDEIRFVRENNLRYLGSPSDGLESDRFLDETLALAQDPAAWPILIHCHGCMDRSPAWMGLYRFLIEGKPLDVVFREIERHRGSRPKAVVSLQYNRKLPPRAPARFAADPTCQLLVRCVAGTEDPFLRPNWNRTATTRRVVTRIEPDPSIRRP